MKAAILLLVVAAVGFVALVPLTLSKPSGSVVQPTAQVLGYCPVSQANQMCTVGIRSGMCQCKTLDPYYPQYAQRDNCKCVIPLYIRGTWPNP
jgi:hypothetical protein